MTARSRLDMGEEKIANEIDDYFRCSSLLSLTRPNFWLSREQLIFKRNKRMGARVIELLLNNPGPSFYYSLFSGDISYLGPKHLLISCSSGQSFFFAFGAGHFVGEHTILEVVKKAGFKVDQVTVFSVENKENFHLNNDITGEGQRRSYHMASRSWSAKRCCLSLPADCAWSILQVHQILPVWLRKNTSSISQCVQGASEDHKTEGR